MPTEPGVPLTKAKHMPNLQQPYEHEPISHVTMTPTMVVQPITRPPITFLQANTLSELITTLQRLVTDNPSLADAIWYGYDDMCLRFDGYVIEPDFS